MVMILPQMVVIVGGVFLFDSRIISFYAQMDSQMNEAGRSLIPGHTAIQWSHRNFPTRFIPTVSPLWWWVSPGRLLHPSTPRSCQQKTPLPPSYPPTSWLSLSPSSRLPFMVATFRRFCIASWVLPCRRSHRDDSGSHLGPRAG